MPFRRNSDGSTRYDSRGKLKLPMNHNLSKELPPLRDDEGRPLKRDSTDWGSVDWDKWAEEIAQKKGEG